MAAPDYNDLLLAWSSGLKRDTPVPYYYQLKQMIKNDIESGALKHGDQIPTEHELSAALGISRPTIRQCMSELVNEGYLVRVKGKGTFVTGRKIEANYIQRHQSFHTMVRESGLTPSTKVLSFKLIPGIPEYNEKLQIPITDELFYLHRLCLANDEPMLLIESYMPAKRFPGLLEVDFSDNEFYATLRSKYGLKPLMLIREIESRNARPEEARLLSIPRNKAISYVTNVALDEDNVPFEYSVSRYRSDRHKFTVYMRC